MSPLLFTGLLAASLALQYLLPQVWSPLLYIDFPLILVFQTSRRAGSMKGTLHGWSAGLGQDLLLSSAYPVGLQATTKMLVGVLSSQFTKNLNMDHPGIQSLMVFALTALNHFLTQAIFEVYGQKCPVSGILPILFCAAFTALANFPIWWITARHVKITA